MSSPLTSPLAAPSTPVSATAASASTTAATTSEDEFLQLLVAELKNQSPDNAADPTQFVTELAQFAELGQATQSASDLNSINAAITGAVTPSATTPAATGATPAAAPVPGTSSTTGVPSP